MKLSSQNRDLLEQVALALGPLREEVVFVGGAIVGLLLTDPAVDLSRPTDDVDLIVEVATTMAYKTTLRDRLLALGFREDPSEKAPLCRWLIGSTKVDIMPTAENVLGFDNRWYPIAIRTGRKTLIRPDLQIRVISPALFLATKLEAFADRGRGDFLGSPDLEDIVAVVDGCVDIAAEVLDAPDEVRSYVADGIAKLLRKADFRDGLFGHLGYERATRELAERLVSRLTELSRSRTP